MNKYQKIGCLAFLALHLSIIINFNLFGINGYQRKEVFDHLSKNGQSVFTAIKNFLPTGISKVLEPYAHLAGIDTGYGLFAPNVPSAVSVAFELVDPAGQSTVSLPMLNTREGLDRFNVNFNTFKNFEETRPLLAYGWAIRMLELNPGHNKITVVIGSHIHPSMEAYRRGERSKFVESVRYEFELDGETNE
ncbi:hypothetical protein [Haliscomenobacter hydrossis]|uniref:Uncharacterized protein n=1 Tax=Haliscomenobacter hydrossis (strain ATCC 27775 / DSM 1100 / LMG 10767 / O) TaxID=760192 RepID=F4L3F2_HALH1|nr:hypothetical protein [Haliscomenobacter hydrossis]AEE52929.1 hypothetical protein Halhy_5103 [Haliscomenobacter hydrossis DSM 1100]